VHISILLKDFYKYRPQTSGIEPSTFQSVVEHRSQYIILSP